jgi:hypothetical protein
MLKLAAEGGITKAWADEALDRMIAAAAPVADALDGRGMRKATVDRIVACVEANRARLAWSWYQ